MFYRYPQKYEVLALDVTALQPIALAHTVGAFALLCFLVAHLYLTTTGHTLTSNLKAMVTGWEELAGRAARGCPVGAVPRRPPAKPRAGTAEEDTMNDRPMNPYLAGFLLGLVLLLTVFVTGRGLGASGAIKSARRRHRRRGGSGARRGEPLLLRSCVGPGHENPLKAWLVFEVLGVLIGAFVSGLSADRLKLVTEKGPRVSVRGRLLFAAAGGALFGAGAQLARGCTSGAALSGMAVLSVGRLRHDARDLRQRVPLRVVHAVLLARREGGEVSDGPFVPDLISDELNLVSPSPSASSSASSSSRPASPPRAGSSASSTATT